MNQFRGADTGGPYTVLCDHVYEPLAQATRPLRFTVRAGRIADVADLDDGPPPAGGDVLDLRRHVLLPLLVDTHVHLRLDPWPLEPRLRTQPELRPIEEELPVVRRRAAEALAAGVGLVRDLGDLGAASLAAVEVARHDRRIAKVAACGPALYRAGCYGRWLGQPFADSESLCAGIRRWAADPRVSVIKLIPTGIVNFKRGRVTTAPFVTPDELQAAVDLAHELGKPVAAHASGDEGIRLAVAAGVDFIEHGYLMTRPTLDLLIERQLTWTPTFAPVHVQWRCADRCGWNGDVRGRLRQILDDHAAMLRIAHASGCRILAGSDAGAPGVSLGGGLWLELELMQQAGIPAADLLTMVTWTASQALGTECPWGRIAAGAPASFLAVAGRVDRDVRLLREIRWVARDGRIVPGRPPRMSADPAVDDQAGEPAVAPSPAHAEPRA
ncbi:MAG: hypothetical protein DCC67_05635 [Planctomycetota bacterium]|nr:MAG: hypothetical protein DCC67_05635 [Planctomycetota bacterium]